MYFYKLTLRNGMNYYVKDREMEIPKFMESIARDRSWRDFMLADEETYIHEFGDVEVQTNTVMLLTSEIIAVEYLSKWQEMI